MAKKRQLERKKKARESKAKARVEASRHKAMTLKKDERRQAKLNNKFREKIVPFIKDPEKKKAMEEAEGQKSRDKLERNKIRMPRKRSMTNLSPKATLLFRTN